MKAKKLSLYTMLLLACAIFANKALATNDVLIVLDPDRCETVENNSRALVIKTLLGLQEKAAPILVSSNILEIIMKLKQAIGNDLQQLRTFIKNSSDMNGMIALSNTLATSHNMVTEPNNQCLQVLSLIDFDNQNLNCYLHKSADLALLIPKQYLQSNKPQSSNLNPIDQARACGFNPTPFIATDDLSTDNLLKKLQEQQIATTNTKDFIGALTSCFISQKQNEQKWVIYLVGHGGSSASIMTNIHKRLEIAKKNLADWEKTVPRKNDIKDELYIKQQISSSRSQIQKDEQLIAKNKGLMVSSESAMVAGINLNDFSRLIQFFDKNINTAFLHYSTCFGGGYNQAIINQILSSLQANYIVSAEGIDESMTVGFAATFIPNNAGSGLILAEQFSTFFQLLRLYIDEPEKFVKTKAKGKDPLSVILRAIVPEMQDRNQPFIRIPSVGTFKALSLEKDVKNLTQSIVTAHEIEKKPIDLSNPEIFMVIITPSRINVPLNLGKASGVYHKAIVSPTPNTISPSYEIIHVFKEINFENTIQSLLFHLTLLNSRLNTQTFIIKKLTRIFCENSGLPVTGKECTIHNFIIQIKGIAGTGSNKAVNPIKQTPVFENEIEQITMGANMQIAFELNGRIYQAMVGVKSFFDPNLVTDFESISFTSESAEKTNMETLANKFLTAQEITKIKKPITLNSIETFIDSKINTQKPPTITKETQSQSGVINEAMIKFLEQKEKT